MLFPIESLVSSLNQLINPDLFERVITIWQRLKSLRQPQALYESLEYESCLELLDIKGKDAIHHKQMKLRFLRDDVFAIQDHVWGDGELFAEYKCSPGKAVDYYRDGQSYRVLISLQNKKMKGDIEDFYIERRIKNGFTNSDESFQSKINYPTQKFSVSVIFPLNKLPKKIVLFEQSLSKAKPLNINNSHFLPDGRLKVIWSIDMPRLFEIYAIRWEW